jgi:hypothetical protein
MALQQFSESELKLTQHDAFVVLRFFWLEPGILPQQLTVQDRAFAQALLVEAIDRSYDMGYVEIIFRNFYGKLPESFESIRDMVKSFAKAAAEHWFEHATGKDLENPKIYESVRRVLSANFYSVWQIRVQTGELTY